MSYNTVYDNFNHHKRERSGLGEVTSIYSPTVTYIPIIIYSIVIFAIKLSLRKALQVSSQKCKAKYQQNGLSL